ncbi:type II secretion system F family protein [Vibrio maerlii]|uniref:type II secretion system F family protein n=1 Tax=Vibrio maerlii TaxID=2231648 RepID=UPI000E3CBCC0|nr:type II secretion system F family protein [Vibrio maerlii]
MERYFNNVINLVDDELILLILILLSAMLLVFAIGYVLLANRQTTLKKRIREVAKESESLRVSQNQRSTKGGTLESLAPVIATSSGKESESIRIKLMHAGYHDASALTAFYIIKIVTFTLGVLVAATLYFYTPDIDKLYLYMALSVGVGLLLPNIVLERIGNKRKSRIKSAIPDALDLLVVCTESGLGLNASIKKVADEVMISHPEFADELDTVCSKISAGVEMSDAFADLVERTGVRDIQGLVSTLTHAAKIGGSVAQTLREFNEDYRDKRNQEVEEVAAKIPTKMIFPLLLFIWPCFFIVAIGPSIINLMESMGNR